MTATADGLVPLSSETVEFTGARGGDSPFTWGQLAFWRLTRWLDDDDPFYNMSWVLPVYGRRDLDAVLSALRALVERHEALRTTFEQTPEGPVQHVADRGRFTVEVFDTNVKPLAAARELAAGMAARAFEYAADLPFRCAVVTVDGRPRMVAFALCHLAVDGGALDVLARDWRSLLAGAEPPGPVWQPMDQAAFEQEGAGAARGERALRHWRAQLERVPMTMFDFPPVTPEEPRFIRLGMESVAAAAATETLAARWSVSASTVLTTASAVLLSALTGHRQVVMQLIVANRHDPRVASMAGTAAQDGLFVLDLPGGTFADATRAGHRQALTAYRNAQYDAYRMMALREEVGRERGGPINLSAYFNDARTITDWPHLPAVDPPGDPAAIAALTGRTRVFHVASWAQVDATAMFSTGPATDVCQLYLMVDTAYVPRSTTQALLLGMETLLVAAVAGDVPLDGVAELCGITPVERPAATREHPEPVDAVPMGASPMDAAPIDAVPMGVGPVDTGPMEAGRLAGQGIAVPATPGGGR
ncbi:condensation domain-containing protein [Streptosporangium longisporum]|uniref:Condensation domain-containing protein n=1 Tax=Streptosporangium longisporum TaxID=46187 RepID=A0ABP6L136_9ACTN